MLLASPPGRRPGAGVGHRRGPRCADAGVHQADDGAVAEVAASASPEQVERSFQERADDETLTPVPKAQ